MQALSSEPQRLDADPMRVAETRKQLGEAKKMWFDDPYGDQQLHLRILGTHLDYRRLGAGTMLVHWGQELAAKEGVVVTLFASPMGSRLYTKLGFRNVGTVQIHAETDGQSVDRVAMVWGPQDM